MEKNSVLNAENTHMWGYGRVDPPIQHENAVHAPKLRGIKCLPCKGSIIIQLKESVFSKNIIHFAPRVWSEKNEITRETVKFKLVIVRRSNAFLQVNSQK